MRFDIYCTVVDNYGDAGVCLRLSRALRDLGHTVRLYCDDLKVLRTIAAPKDESARLAFLPFEAPPLAPDADAVIAAFLCHLPEASARLINARRGLVIYLDYLSAESWVEDFHGLSAPAEFARGYYFYPGFTAKTGGLLIEPRLRKLAAQHPASQAAAESKTGVRQVTLFSYHNQALPGLLALLEGSSRASELTVFAGLALDNLNELLGTALQPGDKYVSGRLRFTACPMVSQQRYDEILCACALNLVRGEDSIVRAMSAGRPFLWQIYPQAEDAHILKLKAFLKVFTAHNEGSAELNAKLEQLLLAYNERANFAGLKLDDIEAAWAQACRAFQRYLFALPDLAKSLTAFCAVKLREP